MENELKPICSELAKSSQRETKLEDVVKKLKERIVNLQRTNKRSSNCSSDSGYNSERVRCYDPDSEEEDRMESQVKRFVPRQQDAKQRDETPRSGVHERCLNGGGQDQSQTELASTNTPGDINRFKNLQTTCDYLRRRLTEEKQSNSNFEYLFLAMQNKLREACAERDVLREAVVPQLCTRLLEIEASSYSTNKLRRISLI